jgi:hypothetical protein
MRPGQLSQIVSNHADQVKSKFHQMAKVDLSTVLSRNEDGLTETPGYTRPRSTDLGLTSSE